MSEVNKDKRDGALSVNGRLATQSDGEKRKRNLQNKWGPGKQEQPTIIEHKRDMERQKMNKECERRGEDRQCTAHCERRILSSSP